MIILLALLPIGLILGVLPFPYASVLSRVLLIVSVSGGISRGAATLRRAEARWVLLLCLFLVAGATSALFSVDIQASLLDLGRQGYMVVFSVMLMLVCRGTRARKILGQGMIVLTVAGIVAIAYLYWMFGSGVSSELGAFKNSVSQAIQDVAMNPIAGLTVLTLFLSVPAFPRSKFWLWLLLAVFAPVLVLTGARTTILAVPLAAMLYWVINYFRRRPTVTIILSMALVFALLAALVAEVRIPASTIDDLDEATTHRTYLWAAAWNRFCQYPWLGAGADTWLQDLQNFLPAVPDHDLSERFMQLVSGAYHNAYLTYLAERGLAGFLPGLLMMFFVLRSALHISTYRDLFAPRDRLFATVAPIGVLFILIRQLGETSGFIAYATGPTDFAAFAAASLVVALTADLEDATVTVRSADRAVLFGRQPMVNWS